MKISCIQMDMRLGAADENFAHAEALIREAVSRERPDVAVLPETWNTGFFPQDLTACADRDGARTKAVFSALARELSVNIVCGSVANRRGDGFCNTAYVFDRSGEALAEYDKTHLFTPSGEHHAFRAGDRTCRFQLDGKKCGLIICYDIRFPELTRTLALEGVDLLFVVAQWPEKRTMHLETLARARAIENQMFLALCNSVGAAGETRCGGHSAVIDPWGEYLARAWDGEETSSGQGKQVHLVMVMNEAFSDITDDPAFTWEEDPLPNLHALQRDPHALSGHVVVPGFAGGTANTEFDVLTGMQTNALSAATTSALRVVNRNLDSVLRVFGDEGYHTSFFHPGDDWFYNRENVYRWLGAEETVFADEMEDLEYKGRLYGRLH